jgi:hypothetical protein
VLRSAWAEVRDRLAGAARKPWLDAAERALFADNARTLYRLEW